MKIKSKKTSALDIILKIFLVVLAVIFATPLYITLINIFKSTKEIAASPMSFPLPPIIDNIVQVIKNPNVNLGEMYLSLIHIFYLDEQSDGFSVKNNVHVQSYGGLNLHIVGSRNDIGVNYFFEGDVNSDAYDSFATAKVQQIMDQAGAKDDFTLEDEEELFRPVLQSVEYDPVYNVMRLSGRNFGSDIGTVTFNISGEEKVIAAEQVKEWSRCV